MRPAITRTPLLAIGIAALALLCTTSAHAADKEMVIRTTAMHFMPDVGYRAATDDGFPVEVDSGSDTGWGIGFEIFATERLGIAFQVATAKPSIRINVDGAPIYPVVEARDDLGMMMYAASLNLHLTSGRAVDVYVSPVLAYMSFDDLEFTVEVPDGPSDTLQFDVKRDVTWGIGIGIDVPLGDSGWLATASATYLDSTLEFDQLGEAASDSLGFDPVIVSAGIGYKF